MLVPVAIYATSEGGGCASTPEPRPGTLTAEQVRSTIPGNTFKLVDQEAYAFVDSDGSLRGHNLPNGASKGRWTVGDDGVLCSTWGTPEGEDTNCDTLAFISERIGYQWGGNALILLPGNPKNI